MDNPAFLVVEATPNPDNTEDLQKYGSQRMITSIIPEQLHAVFRHEGPISYLPEALKYICGSWLPKSDYQYVEKPDLEL